MQNNLNSGQRYNTQESCSRFNQSKISLETIYPFLTNTHLVAMPVDRKSPQLTLQNQSVACTQSG
jgi:hypothetical protein